MGFLDDPSVKVRAALAYGLLHTRDAPRPILLALLQDSPVIARAVVQYSPALLDADLIGLARTAPTDLLAYIVARERIGLRLAETLVERRDRAVTLRLLQRPDVPFDPRRLLALATEFGTTDATLRGALLARADLPAKARLHLVEAAAAALRDCRMVKGAIAPRRLERLLRDTTDTAMTSIGEREVGEGRAPYAADLVAGERVSARLMLHAIVNGHVLFLAECLAQLAETSRDKVFTLLERGSRPALNALLVRCGLGDAVRNMICRLIFHARSADLADDVAARHFVITALTEELIVEHEGPSHRSSRSRSPIFPSRTSHSPAAPRAVMAAFGGTLHPSAPMPAVLEEERLALPAA